MESRMCSDAERMEVRSYVQLAGEAIAQYWPMRTFIHHNPLHGLENLPFDQAVKRGEQLFGGRGYLPNGAYRRYFEQGLIRIEAAILVERDNQKGILIGRGGSMLKRVGSEARQQIEAFLGAKVYLGLFVKVRERWRENQALLDEMGLGESGGRLGGGGE